eukprot:c21583_g2_i1 orf=137-364(-)
MMISFQTVNEDYILSTIGKQYIQPSGPIYLHKKQKSNWKWTSIEQDLLHELTIRLHIIQVFLNGGIDMESHKMKL